MHLFLKVWSQTHSISIIQELVRYVETWVPAQNLRFNKSLRESVCTFSDPSYAADGNVNWYRYYGEQ